MMGFSVREMRVVCVVAITFLAWSVVAQVPANTSTAGTVGFRLTKVQGDLVVAPDYGVSSQIDFLGVRQNRRWFRIEAEFMSLPEWADDLMVRYYALVGHGRDAKLFVGEVAYVNVAKGARHYSAMFLHPSTVDRFGRGQVENIAVEIVYQGRIVDQMSKSGSRDIWWKGYAPVSGYLLKPQDTPWSVLSQDRYEALKLNQ